MEDCSETQKHVRVVYAEMRRLAIPQIQQFSLLLLKGENKTGEQIPPYEQTWHVADSYQLATVR